MSKDKSDARRVPYRPRPPKVRTMSDTLEKMQEVYEYLHEQGEVDYAIALSKACAMIEGNMAQRISGRLAEEAAPPPEALVVTVRHGSTILITRGEEILEELFIEDPKTSAL